MSSPEDPVDGAGSEIVQTSVEEVLRRARERITRVAPEDLEDAMAGGALVIDIRPPAQRQEEGPLPGAVVVERNVLEWRLDPSCEHSLAEARDHERYVVVVCSEGYASSLAAASVLDLGHKSAGDLIGGYKAWVRHRAGRKLR